MHVRQCVMMHQAASAQQLRTHLCLQHRHSSADMHREGFGAEPASLVRHPEQMLPESQAVVGKAAAVMIQASSQPILVRSPYAISCLVSHWPLSLFSTCRRRPATVPRPTRAQQATALLLSHCRHSPRSPPLPMGLAGMMKACCPAAAFFPGPIGQQLTRSVHRWYG